MRGPRLGIQLVRIAFQQDEIGQRFNRHQTRLGMKCLVLAERDLPWTHLRCQAGVLLLRKFHQRPLEFDRQLVLAAIARGDEVIQVAQLEELAEPPRSAGPRFAKHQVGRDEHAVQKVQSVGALEKLDHASR